MPQKLLPPFLFLICCVAMITCSLLFPQWTYLPKPWNYLGVPLLLLGLGMVRNIQGKFKKEATEINTFKSPKKLVSTGLFRYSRNPIYLGFTLALGGLAIVLGNYAALDGLIAFFIAAHLWYIPYEEEAMEKEFGEAYLDYKSKVRRWL